MSFKLIPIHRIKFGGKYFQVGWRDGLPHVWWVKKLRDGTCWIRKAEARKAMRVVQFLAGPIAKPTFVTSFIKVRR